MRRNLMVLPLLALQALAQDLHPRWSADSFFRYSHQHAVYYGNILAPSSWFDPYDLGWMRTRLGLVLTSGENLELATTLEAVRVLGMPDVLFTESGAYPAQDAESASFIDRDVGAHELYLALRPIDGTDLWLRAGRMTRVLGSGRFFGDSPESLGGRSHDGAELRLGLPDGSKLMAWGDEVHDVYVNSEFGQRSFGLYWQDAAQGHLELFTHVDDFPRREDRGDSQPRESTNVLGTVGLEAHLGQPAARMQFRAARQFGHWDTGGAIINPRVTYDHFEGSLTYSGWMAGADLMTEHALPLGRLAARASIEQTSGDDPDHSTGSAWQELYPASFRFHGGMDIRPGVIGLRTGRLGLTWTLGRAEVAADAWWFGYVKERVESIWLGGDDFLVERTRDLGSELDLAARWHGDSPWTATAGIRLFHADPGIDLGDSFHAKMIHVDLEAALR